MIIAILRNSLLYLFIILISNINLTVEAFWTILTGMAVVIGSWFVNKYSIKSMKDVVTSHDKKLDTIEKWKEELPDHFVSIINCDKQVELDKERLDMLIAQAGKIEKTTEEIYKLIINLAKKSK